MIAMQRRFNCFSFYFILSSYFALLRISLASPTYDVTQYGAQGNGQTDDTKAFQAAWKAVCQDAGNATLYVPSGKSFLLGQIFFRGPCNSTVHVQIDGNIVRPTQLWSGNVQFWIVFQLINGLNIGGLGLIDGQGYYWWACRYNHQCQLAPDAFGIYNSQNVQLSKLRFIDSPKMHVTIVGCNGVKVSELTMSAPGDSPNTDGIHIQESHHVVLWNLNIETGDDCVSIGTGSSDVNVSHITCGPGHGISIGSLGQNNSRAQVEQIHVSNSHLKGTTNGLRIKTWQGGSGYARGISFMNINLTAVQNPIIINQNYCDKGAICPPQETSAVEVSDVQYTGIQGTSIGDVAINLNCSQSVPCTGISMYNVDIQPDTANYTAQTVCINAQGTKGGITRPEVPCLN